MTKVPVYLQIVFGLLAGVAWGLVSNIHGFNPEITIYYIKPIGTIFITLLKMIAVPLVLASLIVGVANLDDIRKLSKIGGKTIGIYMLTTIIALVVGLGAVNLFKPGKAVSTETRDELLSVYGGDISNMKDNDSELHNQHGPLTPLINVVPENIVSSASKNQFMLQIVFVAVLFGVAVVKLGREKSRSFLQFFASLNEVTLVVIDFIMKLAPYAVFALISALIVEVQRPDLLAALLQYSITVFAGLLVMMFVIYPSIVFLFTKIKIAQFFKAIYPAQLLGFSTSSSSATLPVTMSQVEKKIGVSEKVSSFVLPLGATINMDGTSLYQAVAAVFIAQIMGNDLNLAQQLTIVLTALLASIGSAGVPGAGMVMLAIVLESVNIPVEYIAFIMAPDRILDMCRTAVNITGDAAVATVVASSEGELSLKA